jgi:S1-C subfamily serine protease
MKKFLAFSALLLVIIFLGGCDLLTLPDFFPTISQATTQTTRTIDHTGIISIEVDDYQSYTLYHSNSYDLNVDSYNDVLIGTRDKIRRANIKIQATLYETRSLYPFGSTTIVNSVSKGSGVIFMEDDDYYYAITNFHVIDPITYTPVYEVMTFEDDDYHQAEVVASDSNLDLAVVRFEKDEREQVRMLNIIERSFTKFTAGELVLAVGNPLSVAYNVTYGEFINMVTLTEVTFKVIYHSAIIHEGSSGGALVDVDANLLGINTWGAEENDEVAYAVPVSIVYMFLHNNGLLP